MKFFFYGLKEDVDEVKQFFNQNDDAKTIETSDIVVIVGGDGALLNEYIKEQLIKTKKPTLKIHHRHNSYKSLGFTMDVNLKNLETALLDIENNDYFPEQLRLIKVDANYRTFYAINDIAINSVIPNRSILMKTSLSSLTSPYDNDVLIATPKCTGIVVSTPHGSTAWNLALDGAVILEHDFDCMLLNFRESPMKPTHYAFSKKSYLNFEAKEDIVLTIDGKTCNVIDFKEPIRVQLAQETRIFNIRTKNTYESIDSKLQRYNKFQFQQVK
jgi:NAD kinase